MAFKTVIIDDDSNGIQAILNMLDQFSYPADVVGTAQTIEEGIPLLNQHKPDLLFLDIEMKNESGFDLLDVWQNENTKVVFCTGYDHYAIKALKNGAFDYILKPLDYREFSELFKKLEQAANQNETITEPQTEEKEKLTVKSPGGIYIIDYCEINFLKADGRYTIINYDDDKEVTSSKNIGAYDGNLKCANFSRVNKSMIINSDRLKGVEKRGAKSYLIFTEMETEVSDGLRKSIMKTLD